MAASIEVKRGAGVGIFTLLPAKMLQVKVRKKIFCVKKGNPRKFFDEMSQDCEVQVLSQALPVYFSLDTICSDMREASWKELSFSRTERYIPKGT